MSKKILYFGGQKSGKSFLAEHKALLLAEDGIPYYIATYDNSYNDTEMQERICKHQNQRQHSFISIEETKYLERAIKLGQTHLIECVSMWILNTLNEHETVLLKQLEHLLSLDANIVFVLNNVTEGVIPFDVESRKYVDRSGVVGQKLAALCDEVYEVKLGLEVRLK